MNRLAVILGLLVCCTIAPGANEFTSVSARFAQRKYDAALAKANADRDKAVSDATQTYLQEMDKALKEATKMANLDEANRISAAVKLAKSKAPSESKLPAGIWEIHYANGTVRRYQFNADGSVDRKELVGRPELQPGRGKLERRENEWVMEEFTEHRKLERFNFANGRLFVEHFFFIAQYPDHAQPILGVGKPVDQF